MRAAVAAADPGALVRRAVAQPDVADAIRAAAALDVVSVGKAASAMASAFGAAIETPARRTLTVGVADAGHPVPDHRSVSAAARALEIAGAAHARDLMVVLLSGGASALMALPAGSLSLDDKQRTVGLLLAAGADISELNTVRKHLSGVKGGRLAAACPGRVLTLALSDVVGDDVSVIGSGPTVTDATTCQMALDVIDRRGGRGTYPRAAVALLERGAAGGAAETPKPGDARLSRSSAHVIGGRMEAIEGARLAAQSLGYRVRVIREPVVGIARDAAAAYAGALARLLPSLPRPACIVSAGETTVHVTGRGRGGRNQEFALALARPLASIRSAIAIVSVGTDGIDGPTDAAGAIVDGSTLARAATAGVDPEAHLTENDSFHFFDTLGDLVRLGPTGTNVGDLQVALVKE